MIFYIKYYNIEFLNTGNVAVAVFYLYIDALLQLVQAGSGSGWFK